MCFEKRRGNEQSVIPWATLKMHEQLRIFPSSSYLSHSGFLHLHIQGVQIPAAGQLHFQRRGTAVGSLHVPRLQQIRQLAEAAVTTPLCDFAQCLFLRAHKLEGW